MSHPLVLKNCSYHNSFKSKQNHTALSGSPKLGGPTIWSSLKIFKNRQRKKRKKKESYPYQHFQSDHQTVSRRIIKTPEILKHH